jgi:transposase
MIDGNSKAIWETKSMDSIPMLSDAQWRKISPLLPETKRDPRMVSAILYLEHSGQSLRHTAEVFAVTKSRLGEWHGALAVDGGLARIMTMLKLKAAGPLARRGGGGPEWYARPGREAQAAAVTAIRLQNFGAALLGRR